MALSESNIIVIGGGISGVSCATTLASLDSNYRVHLISASPVVKEVGDLKKKGHQIEEFKVVESTGDDLARRFPNVNIIYGLVERLDASHKLVYIGQNRKINYDRLCICTGARPKLIEHSCNDYVIGIRDTSSVNDLINKISSAKRIVGTDISSHSP